MARWKYSEEEMIYMEATLTHAHCAGIITRIIIMPLN